MFTTAQYKLIPGLPAATDNNRIPVKLTKEQIDFLVSFIPQPLVGGNNNRELIYQQRKALVAEQLAKEEICIESIPDIMNDIINAYTTSEVVPGTPVGNIIASMIGRLLSQATLSSFHKAGLESSSDSAITSTLSLLYMSKDPARQLCTLYFTNPLLTHREVLTLAKDIEEVTLYDFISDYSYLNTNSTRPDWWQQIQINNNTNYTNIWSNYTSYVRVVLNKKLLYKYKIVPQQLVQHFLDIDDNLIIFTSPIRETYLDIFAKPDLSKLPNHRGLTSSNLLEQLYLENAILDKKIMSSKLIAGVAGLKNMRSRRIPLSSITKETTVLYNGRNYPALYFPPENIRRYNITTANLQRWLNTAGLLTLVIDNKVLADIVLPDKKTLIAELASRKESEDEKSYIKNMGPLALHSEYVYAMVEGNNLLDLYQIEYIDSTRTICDNIRILEQVLGVEGARNFFIVRLPDILATAGITIEPCLINTLASIQCNRGQFFGTNYTGVTLQAGVNILDVGTIQRTVEASINGIFNSEQPLATSTSVMTGVPVKIGTGSITVAYKGTSNGKEFLAIGEEIHRKIKESDFEHKLREQNKINLDNKADDETDVIGQESTYDLSKNMADNRLDDNEIDMSQLSSDSISEMSGGIAANSVLIDSNFKQFQNLTNILNKYSQK